MKRAFDLVAAVVGLVLLAPVMAVIAVLVRRDSEGPVFFRQERIGREGRPFTILKFRSMVVSEPRDNPLITAEGDIRITKIGARLRASKLDEIPQLVNVVRGDMSIVGPRPEVPLYVASWSALEKATILSVRPGITDPATVLGRRESEDLAAKEDPEAFYRDVLVPRKATAYCEYVRNRTFVGDLGVILRTLRAVLRG